MGDLRSIPPEILSAPVAGVNLFPGPLRSQLAAGGTLLVFLRQLGCTFCRETVAELRSAATADPSYPPVLFFFMGSPREGRAFMQRYWPAARAVSDPAKRFYAAFGIERGGLLQMFGPAVWRAKQRAAAKGHSNGERIGDLWMLPGIFVVRDERIAWAHEPRHAADHPDFRSIPVVSGLRSEAPGRVPSAAPAP